LGHIEAGDYEQFGKGLYNGLANWVGLPEFDVDERYAGAEEMGRQLGQNLALEGAGAVAAKVGAMALGALRSSGSIGAGRAYSVVMEVTLETRWGKRVSDAERRALHAEEAKRLISGKIEALRKSADRESRALVRRLDKLLSDPSKWNLHHDAEREGVMQLISKTHHYAEELQDLLHPYVEIIRRRAGGFYFWGRKF